MPRYKAAEKEWIIKAQNESLKKAESLSSVPLLAVKPAATGSWLNLENPEEERLTEKGRNGPIYPIMQPEGCQGQKATAGP